MKRYSTVNQYALYRTNPAIPPFSNGTVAPYSSQDYGWWWNDNPAIDIESVSKLLTSYLQRALDNDPTLTYEIVRVKPNSIVEPPINVGVAYLQASWYFLECYLKTKDRKLLDFALQNFNLFLDDPLSLEDVDPNHIVPIMENAKKEAAKLGVSVSETYTHLQRNANAENIQDTQKFVEDHSGYFNKYLAQAGENIATPFLIAAGLITGQKPKRFTQRQWNLIRFGLYGAGGLAVFAYLLTIGKPYVELLQSTKDEK